MTPKQKEQFNKMLAALKRIKSYDSPDRIRKNSEKDYGLDYKEALEMAYDNIQGEADYAIKNIRPIK